MKKIRKNCCKTLFFPMIAEYPKLTPRVAKYSRGNSATIEPNYLTFKYFSTSGGMNISCDVDIRL